MKSLFFLKTVVLPTDRSLEIEARAMAWRFLERAASNANVVFKRSWSPATSERQPDGTYLVEGKCTINDVKKRYRVKVKPLGGGDWSLEDLQILPL